MPRSRAEKWPYTRETLRRARLEEAFPPELAIRRESWDPAASARRQHINAIIQRGGFREGTKYAELLWVIFNNRHPIPFDRLVDLLSDGAVQSMKVRCGEVKDKLLADAAANVGQDSYECLWKGAGHGLEFLNRMPFAARLWNAHLSSECDVPIVLHRTGFMYVHTTRGAPVLCGPSVPGDSFEPDDQDGLLKAVETAGIPLDISSVIHIGRAGHYIAADELAAADELISWLGPRLRQRRAFRVLVDNWDADVARMSPLVLGDHDVDLVKHAAGDWPIRFGRDESGGIESFVDRKHVDPDHVATFDIIASMASRWANLFPALRSDREGKLTASEDPLKNRFVIPLRESRSDALVVVTRGSLPSDEKTPTTVVVGSSPVALLRVVRELLDERGAHKLFRRLGWVDECPKRFQLAFVCQREPGRRAFTVGAPKLLAHWSSER